MHSPGTINVFHFLLPIGAAIGLASSALAAPITVPNFSFEAPEAVDGDSVYPPTGWTPGGSGYNQFGVTDFDNSSYHGSHGDNAPLPGTAHGGQAASIGIQSLMSVGHLTSSSGLGLVADNTVYRLTVALGNALNFAHPDTSTIQLLVDGAVVSSRSMAATAIPDGTFTDFSTSFTTAAVSDPRTGGMLAIRLQVSSSNPSFETGDWHTDFDNVRLDATPVPEPSTLLLAAGALVGLGITRIRRRRG